MEVVFLLGAAQGIFLAAVLASRTQNVLPNRLLAALVLVFSFDLAMAVYHASAAKDHFPVLIGLDLPIAFLYGPLLYLYVRIMTTESPPLRRADGWHAFPFAACVVFLLPYFVLPGTEKLALLQDSSLLFQTRALTIITPLKLIHGLVYLALVIYLLRRYRRQIKDTFSAVEGVQLAWLRNLTAGMVTLFMIAGIIYVLGSRGVVLIGMDPGGIYDDLTLLSVTIFVYALGYFGLRQPEIIVHHVEPTLPAERASPASYARSGMQPHAAATHKERLLALMETVHPYRQGNLTLQDLADQLGISSHNLTEVLNTQLDQRFYDFVNGYRVREVQVRLKDPASANLTVLAIGMDAGFNAKSSFNAAFKRHTCMTPSEYRRQHMA